MSETVHSHRKPLNQAVGEAIEAYANVEAQLAFLLQALLQIDVNKAYAILFAIQNSRLKNELFQFLLLCHRRRQGNQSRSCTWPPHSRLSS
jgi:hypothetical protein